MINAPYDGKNSNRGGQRVWKSAAAHQEKSFCALKDDRLEGGAEGGLAKKQGTKSIFVKTGASLGDPDALEIELGRLAREEHHYSRPSIFAMGESSPRNAKRPQSPPKPASASISASSGASTQHKNFKLFLVLLVAMTFTSATFAWISLSQNGKATAKAIASKVTKDSAVAASAEESQTSHYLIVGIAVSLILYCCVNCFCQRPLRRMTRRCSIALGLSSRKEYSLLPLSANDVEISRRNSDANLGLWTTEEKTRYVVQFAQNEMNGDFNSDGASFIASIFTCTESSAGLAALKHESDLALRTLGTSLYELVYTVLDAVSRESILLHIDNQSTENVDGQLKSGRRAFVISDMDDTLVSTFKDLRFPFNSLYPGVRQFYHELILSCSSNNLGESSGPDTSFFADWNNAKNQVTFVTARPSWLNSWTKHDLRKHEFKTSVALTGSSYSFITPAMMLARKVKQCREMRRLFPEGEFFLVGDNGQRDIDLGKELIKHGLVKAVFIHDIFAPTSRGDPELVPVKQGATNLAVGSIASIQMRRGSKSRATTTSLGDNDDSDDTDDTDDGETLVRVACKQNQELEMMHIRQSVPIGFRNVECAKLGITLFQSYSGAALAAMQQGILQPSAVANVAVASAEDLATMRFSRDSQRATQRDVFLRDIARITHFLNERGVHSKAVRDNIDNDKSGIAFLQSVLCKLDDLE